MNKYRYTLEKGSKKHYCPNCGKKSLKRYIDIETGNYLPEQYGRCNHENSCSPHYHLNPYLDGYAKMIWEQEQKVTGVTKVTVPKKLFFRTQPKPQPTPEPVFFDLKHSNKHCNPNAIKKIRLSGIYVTGNNFPLKLMRLQRLFSCTDWERL